MVYQGVFRTLTVRLLVWYNFRLGLRHHPPSHVVWPTLDATASLTQSRQLYPYANRLVGNTFLIESMNPPPDDDQIHAHADMVFRTCLRVTGNAQDAADVSQEVFIAWMQARGTIRGPVGAWLHGVARLRSLEFLRRNHRRSNHERQADGPADLADDQAWRGQLDEALSELDGTTRAMVIEHHLMGVEQAALANRFRCTQATVSRRISKAMERLRVVLERRGITAAPAMIPLWFGNESSQPPCPADLLEPLLAHAHVAGTAGMLLPKVATASWKAWIASAAAALLMSTVLIASAARNVPFVGHEGRYLTANGQLIHLHGGSLYGAPWRQAGFDAYVDTWLDQAQADGMNAIRIVDFLDGGNADWRPPVTWLNLDHLIDAIAMRKMYAILDLSTYRNMLERTHGQEQPGISAAYDPARWAAFTAFISARYRNASCLAFYSIAGACEVPAHQRITSAELTRFYDLVSTQLRAGDPHHMISSGGLLFLDWASGIDWKAIFSLPNIRMAAVQVHSKGDETVLPRIADWCRQADVDMPFVIDECGLKQGDDDRARAAQLRDIFALGARYASVGTMVWNIGPEHASDSCDVGPQTPAVWAMLRESEGYFHTGFESADPLPEPAASAAPPEDRATAQCVTFSGGGDRGDQAFRYALPAAQGKPASLRIFRVALAIRSGTRLSYRINPEQEGGRHIAIDLHCSDGTWLHDTKAVDRRGMGMDPGSGHGGTLPLNAWSEIDCELGLWLQGRIVDAIVVSFDHPGGSGPASAYLDEVMITNSGF